MWPDRVSNPGPLTYESGVLPIALAARLPHRWSLASLTFNNYFTYFNIYIYITTITIDNSMPYLKITKEPKQKSRLWMASNKITGGLQP